MTSNKKAIIYCRSACTEQAQPLSYPAKQEVECRLYAEKHGYEVVQVFHDDGLSGFTIDRPAFRLMLITLFAAPEPYTVIATGMERISRDVSEFASICQIIGGLNGELVFSEDAMAGRAE